MAKRDTTASSRTSDTARVKRGQQDNTTVDLYRIARAPSKLTRAQARKELEESKKRRQAAEAARMAKLAADLKGNRDKSAREDIDDALRKLAHVRDLLNSAARGDTDDTQTDALFAHATVCMAAADLERALFDLRVYEGMEGVGKKREGWFANDLK